MFAKEIIGSNILLLVVCIITNSNVSSFIFHIEFDGVNTIFVVDIVMDKCFSNKEYNVLETNILAHLLCLIINVLSY